MDLKEFKADLKPTLSKHEFVSSKHIVNRILIGNIVSNIKSKGLEFEDYRKYTLADDAQRIDWKASLKAHELLIRETVEEKAVNVIFLLDVSDTMLFSSGDKLKCEFAAEIVAGLSFSMLTGGNSVGLFLFNDSIKKMLMPKGGARQYFNMITELKDTRNYGGKSNLKASLKALLAITKNPSMIIIISDFIGADDEWGKYLEAAAFTNSVIGICVRDPLDRRLPENAGYFVIEDPSSESKILIDTKEAFDEYNSRISEEEDRTTRIFKRAASSYIILETTEDYTKHIMNFLEKKSRIIKRSM